jgi:hypothetical protein
MKLCTLTETEESVNPAVFIRVIIGPYPEPIPLHFVLILLLHLYFGLASDLFNRSVNMRFLPSCCVSLKSHLSRVNHLDYILFKSNNYVTKHQLIPFSYTNFLLDLTVTIFEKRHCLILCSCLKLLEFASHKLCIHGDAASTRMRDVECVTFTNFLFHAFSDACVIIVIHTHYFPVTAVITPWEGRFILRCLQLY